jgi:hypothetical protein
MLDAAGISPEPPKANISIRPGNSAGLTWNRSSFWQLPETLRSPADVDGVGHAGSDDADMTTTANMARHRARVA